MDLTVTSTSLLLVAGILSVPLLVLGSECLLAVLPVRRQRASGGGARPRLAVIVPAHDEEGAVHKTVRSVSQQLQAGDRLIVVADNCTDRTAEQARRAGATVWERRDDAHRGKGYAIRFALERLREDPPEVVVNIDADSIPAPGCIDRVARLAARYGRPVQAAYLMSSQPGAERGATSLSAVSAFAVLTKNYVRPRGLQRLGLPCLLAGSGMAFPWQVLEKVPHPSDHIVEDIRFTTDLAMAGRSPLPCVETAVYSSLPSQAAAFLSQRTRWEHGHLSTIGSEAPRLALSLLRSPRLQTLAILLELAVPPLGFLVLVSVAASAVFAAASWAAGIWLPAMILLGAALWAVLGLAAAWLRFGRQTLPAAELLAIPRYLAAKLPLYGRFFTSRQRDWVRTEREPPCVPGSVATPHFAAAASAHDAPADLKR